MFTDIDRQMMQRALTLAERGLYTTMPNPRVGCVIAREGEIVGEGFHERAGEAHAEVNALRAAGAEARAATVYVTLEPCSHYGRTPPCVNALIEAGVAIVIAAMQDPNPLVSGEGIAALRAAGIECRVGLLETEARELNHGFVSRMSFGRPWVRLKVAATLDGKTALADGESQWITGAEARQDGHRFRARACAILSGAGTVRADDPQLTVRGVEGASRPLKVLVDSRLDVPPQARVFDGGPVLIFAAVEDRSRIAALQGAGAEVMLLPNEQGKVDLEAMMVELARRECNEVHVEGGFRLNGSLLGAGVVDELLIYYGPNLIGGSPMGMFDLPAVPDLEHMRRTVLHDVRRIGTDVRVLARIAR
jgi:diaminohydroxyphosphoribosylaminopyrimidine deaminase / 5-amino-6-(5-phosphoribosylamino)uracil reductase